MNSKSMAGIVKSCNYERRSQIGCLKIEREPMAAGLTRSRGVLLELEKFISKRVRAEADEVDVLADVLSLRTVPPLYW